MLQIELFLQKMSRMIGMSPWEVWKDGHEPVHVVAPQPSAMMHAMVAETKGLSSGTLVAKAFGIDLLASDLARLLGVRWLNDQIVNYYLEVFGYVLCAL